MPKAILFDADGTLYNSERLNFSSNQETAKVLYNFEFTWEVYNKNVRRGTKKSYQVLQDQGIDVDYNKWQTFKLDRHKTLISEKLEPLPGLVPFLDWCQVKKIRCIIVSAASLEYINPCLDALDIKDRFEFIISHEDIGNDGKPNPHPYQLALKRAGLKPEEALAVEDTDKGINSAKAAEIVCIGIRNEDNNSKELSGANDIISDYKELKDYLLKT